MTDYLYSAKAKLDWADGHLKIIQDESKCYGERKPYSITHEVDTDGTKHTLRLHVSEEPPLRKWSLVAGDALNNLRSALDHAIYGLAVKSSGQMPPPDEKTLMFPIAETPDEFAKTLWRLGELRKDTGLVTAIEAVQPYKRGDGKRRPALLLLNELNNADKHRLIRIIRAAAHQGRLRLSKLPPDVEITSQLFVSGPMENGTDLVTVTLSRSAPDLEMDFDLGLIPAVSHRPSPNGKTTGEINTVLGDIRDEVAHVLNVLGTAST